MQSIRKISKSGSITIPAHVRREIGIQPGEAVKLDYNELGDIVLKPIKDRCEYCGNTKYDQLTKLYGYTICVDCIDKAFKMLGGSDDK